MRVAIKIAFVLLVAAALTVAATRFIRGRGPTMGEFVAGTTGLFVLAILADLMIGW
ncbi:hypothetical protein HDIA_2425 [Hartmannibacter diazotrophicus]|uniref:Uncharacterized protein n=1 Tax=Hartmannibacter diazotrophicus TaxID=1482074 RepID=A0A2C9D6Q2_9HYPH|nr:hypothetical protein [Hartmannibacter diazotrophicus]SON55966.1 hypothetical protein HDIA_2425 [Hartmannibacter diazotrophicus]